MDKPARTIARKKTSRPTHTARRSAVDKSTSATPAASGTAPRFSRITHSLDVVAPQDCCASVILKEVAHDSRRRYYAMWLFVGRYDQDAMSIRYKYTGEETVRCDIPAGAVISAAALQPYLVKFLNSENKEPEGPPVIIGKGQGSNP
jgi:hypothetical protein